MAKCKYEKREHQVSEDNGMTWVTDEVIKGDLIEYGSADCPDSGSEVTKWVTLENGFICEDNNKYKKQVLYVSYDEGVTWYIYFPTVYQKGEFVGVDESFCSNKFEGHYEIGDETSPIIIPKDPVKIIKCDGNTTLTSNDINYYPAINSNFDVNVDLTDAKIGDCVTSIGDNAFYAHYKLKSITVDTNNTYYDSRNNCNCLIETSTNTLLAGTNNSTIPDSVTSIGNNAFYYRRGFTSIDIPNSVTSIGNYTFYGCSGLRSVAIGSGLTSIGSYAFVGTNIKELSFDCPTVKRWFDNSSISSVTFGNNVIALAERAFQGCYSLTTIDMGYGLTSIGGLAFRQCSGLTSVTIGSSVTNIGAKAFEDCRGLERLYISDSVTTIGDLAFEDCYSLTSCTIGSGVTSIGSYAFKGAKIKELSVDCQTVGGWFDNSRLSSVTLSNNVITIAGGAFANGSSLSSITIPDSVTSIGTKAFDGCSSLTSIDIPNSVTTIGDEAFYYCTSLTSCTIGSGITYIGTMAFNYCDSLTSVTCLAATPPALGDQTFGFYGRYNYPIYVPEAAVDLYKASWPIGYADRIQGIPVSLE